jgi:cytoskeleton protein RodZ
MSDGLAPEADAAVETDVQAATPQGLLRQAREASGLHIAALAAALKVPVKKLEALEAGRFDELPDMVFARALASSACRQIKVDPGPILEQIPAGGKAQLDGSRTAINAPFKSDFAAAPTGPGGWLSLPAVLAAVALMLAALVLVFLPDMASAPAPAPDAQVAAAANSAVLPTASAPAESDAMAPDTAPAVANDAAGAVAATAAPSPQPVAPDAAANPPAGAVLPGVPYAPPARLPGASDPTGAAPADSPLLSIRATRESWIEVTNAAGETMARRLLKAGESVDFSAPAPYAVTIGSVQNTVVRVRGLVFDPTPFAQAGVARFEVK